MLTLIGVPASSLHASAMRIRHTTADPESSMFADLEPLLILLLITTVQCVATSPQLPQAPYELAFSTFGVVTQQSGLIEMVCRNESTAEKLPVNDINIWLNRTLVDDRDLREREDVGIVEVHGCCRLRFNLTHQLGGHYTCGKRIDAANVKESPAKTLNCKYGTYRPTTTSFH